MAILLIEPGTDAHSLLSSLPVDHGGVESTPTLSEAVELTHERQFEGFVLDLRCTGVDAVAAVREVRKLDALAAIVVVRTQASVEERLALMEAGADECLSEPLSAKELTMRLRVLLRRMALLQPKLSAGDLQLDVARRQASRQGKPIPLTVREFAVLECLLRHAGQPVSRTRIFEEVWNREPTATTNIVDVYINYLRAKVDRDFSPKLIHTVYGLGYILAPEQEHTS